MSEGVYAAQIETVWQIRQMAMGRHYADHLDRYVNESPIPRRPPERVCAHLLAKG